MIGVAQDAQGETRVRPVVEAAAIEFPVLIDQASRLAADFGFQVTPAGVFLDATGTVRYVHGSPLQQFDVIDPRVQLNLDEFLGGAAPRAIEHEPGFRPEVRSAFATGAKQIAEGDAEAAVKTWREALDLDPDNFLIRSQIWAAENPDRFWPAVDREWQQAQLVREGYDKPLP